MPDKIHALILAYLNKVRLANKEATKKEAFKDLLNRLYAGEKEIERLIDKISGGAEASVLNIPRADRLHRGSADTLYNKIIIEFERDLKPNLNHAKEQLAGYLLGQFNSGEGYNFTLIATDCITWKVFAPDISQLDQLETITESELILNEVKSASIVLTEKNTEDFYFWIDRFLFKEEKQRATLQRIEESFGYHSNVFIESTRELTRHFSDVKKYGDVQVSLEQWKRFLSIAYGSFDANDETFLIHTYLSIFSKMLAYAVVSNDDYIDDDEMKGILTGDIFYRYNLQNFIENDFFHWVVSDRNFKGLKKVFRLIAQEISSYDFNNVDEDVLKGVYQELIDLDTRHALGEYYTPDWLCERIVNEFHFEPDDKILDPACGSGSFLRAAVHRVKEINPDIDVEQLNNNIYGIDIHPLSVQIAKTTMLLALGKEVISAKYLVLYNSSAKDANATVVNRADIDLEFIVESKGYAFTTDNSDEAYYLCAIINSNTPNLLIKDFQTKGLFGVRDIYKRILDVYFPLFDASDLRHQRLALLGREAHTKVREYLVAIPAGHQLTNTRLGRLRLDIKKYLAVELGEIDELVRGVVA
jgi:hypothetical protein